MNILYNLNKLTEMKGEQINEIQDIEVVFMNSFWEEVNKFHIEELNAIETQTNELEERAESAVSNSVSLDETEGNSQGLFN